MGQRVASKQKCENEEGNHKDARGKQVQAGGAASAKVLRWGHARNILGTRRPVALKQRKWGGGEDEVGR